MNFSSNKLYNNYATQPDNVLFEQLRKRFEKLRTNPKCGEVLSHDKAGHREVHVKDHRVIIYRTDYDIRTIVIVKIGTHDKALGG